MDRPLRFVKRLGAIYRVLLETPAGCWLTDCNGPSPPFFAANLDSYIGESHPAAVLHQIFCPGQKAAGMGCITGRPWVRHHQPADADAGWHGGAQVLSHLLSLGYRKIRRAILAPGTSNSPAPHLPDAPSAACCCACQVYTAIGDVSPARICTPPKS